MCRVLGIHRHGFCTWLRKPVSKREEENERLLEQIRHYWNESDGVYGSSRIFLDLNKTVYGRRLVSVGSNRTAAVFSGINADWTIIKSYCISGIMAVIASILLAGYTGYADMWISDGFELNSLVAAVIGGNFLGGGRGSVLGMLGGVLVTTLVLNIVLVFGLDVTFQYVITGLIFLIATLIGSLSTIRRMNYSAAPAAAGAEA